MESNEFTEQLAFNTFLPLLMEIPRTPSIPVEFIRKQSEMVFKWPLAVFMGVQASSWLMQSKVHLLLPLWVVEIPTSIASCAKKKEKTFFIVGSQLLLFFIDAPWSANDLAATTVKMVYLSHAAEV